MDKYICVTCGTQYPASTTPPVHCPICEDEHQYVHRDGQQWTTLAAIQQTHCNVLAEIEPGLTTIVSEPRFAIGQRAHLIQTPEGNVLWDCVSLIDAQTIDAINQRGGIAAIVISHPHFYSTIVEWSRAFGNAPIYLPMQDRDWVMQPDPAIQFWDGESNVLLSGLTIIRCGGHFPGSSVLHWPSTHDRKGALLTGDTIMAVANRRMVSFMYSYPNLIPLNAPAIRQIMSSIEPYPFDRLYSAWDVVHPHAKEVVRRSAARYVASIAG